MIMILRSIPSDYFQFSDKINAWAGAPIKAFSLFPSGSVTVTKGLENIGTYNKTENSSRKLCMTCGGHLFTNHPSFEMVDVYHYVVSEMEHKPTVHVF